MALTAAYCVMTYTTYLRDLVQHPGSTEVLNYIPRSLHFSRICSENDLLSFLLADHLYSIMLLGRYVRVSLCFFVLFE